MTKLSDLTSTSVSPKDIETAELLCGIFTLCRVEREMWADTRTMILENDAYSRACMRNNTLQGLINEARQRAKEGCPECKGFLEAADQVAFVSRGNVVIRGQEAEGYLSAVAGGRAPSWRANQALAAGYAVLDHYTGGISTVVLARVAPTPRPGPYAEAVPV